jgi:hypothetical protein
VSDTAGGKGGLIAFDSDEVRTTACASVTNDLLFHIGDLSLLRIVHSSIISASKHCR